LKYLTLVFKNLFRSKRRTFLTVLSIAVSLFIFSALVSIPTVADQILGNTASSTRIATHNKAGLAYSIPVAYKQRIATIPHVEVVVPESWFGGVYHEVYDQFPNLAADPEQVDQMWPDWGISQQSFEQFKKIRTAALVGADTMKKFNLQVGQQIQLRGTLYPFNVTLQIVGTISGKAPPDFLLFRRDYLEEAAGRPGIVDNIWVKVDKPENVPQVIAAIDEGFANSSAETLSESEAAFIGSFMDQYRTFFRMAEILGFIVVLTIGLVAANTAAMSIRERRGEIAVLRTVGFSNSQILASFLTEAFAIALAGGVAGTLAAALVMNFVRGAVPALGAALSTGMPYPIMLGGVLIALCVGLLSALAPTMAALRTPVHQSLREVI